jgi:hypothetical protein
VVYAHRGANFVFLYQKSAFISVVNFLSAFFPRARSPAIRRLSMAETLIFVALKKSICTLLVAAAAQLTLAQAGGKGAFSILKLPANARASAWGGSSPAYKNADASFLMINPALLGPAAHKTVVSNFNTQFPGVWSGNAAYAMQYKNKGYFGAAVSFINYGTMKAYDEGGNEQGMISANETAVTLAWAKPMDERISFGMSVKGVYSVLAGFVANGAAIDAGAVYTSEDSVFSAAMVFRNAGFQFQHYLNGSREGMPFQAELGLNFKPKHMPFRFNIVAHDLQQPDLTYNQYLQGNVLDLSGKTVASKPAGFGEKVMRHMSFGTELVLGKGIGILVGYNHQRRKELAPEALTRVTGYSWGLYVKLGKFHLTYSSAAYFPGYNMNLFSFSARLSDFQKKSASSQQ